METPPPAAGQLGSLPMTRTAQNATTHGDPRREHATESIAVLVFFHERVNGHRIPGEGREWWSYWCEKGKSSTHKRSILLDSFSSDHDDVSSGTCRATAVYFFFDWPPREKFKVSWRTHKEWIPRIGRFVEYWKRVDVSALYKIVVFTQRQRSAWHLSFDVFFRSRWCR